MVVDSVRCLERRGRPPYPASQGSGLNHAFGVTGSPILVTLFQYGGHGVPRGADTPNRGPVRTCTIIIRGNEHNVNPLVYARAGYEPKDFSPIVRAVSGPAVIP